jgi:hypothetical protein
MRKVAVVGVGETKFSGAQTRTNTELFTEAVEALPVGQTKTSRPCLLVRPQRF